jgi:NAD dependent epimerase/dehydratase
MSTDTVLVTGAGGFIGSHLVETLLARGERVRALVRYTSSGGVGFLDAVKQHRERLEIFHGDIRDARAVKQAATGCQRIYHLAALIGIPYSYVAPDSYVAVNVQGTLHVLEAARDLGVERVVMTSTSEVYGTAQYTPIDEKHPVSAQSPYAATKVGADQLALSYHRSYGVPVTVVRPFNTYGPRQSARAVIPTIITQALAADAIHLGSLDPVRDLVYVADTARGFVEVAVAAECVGKVTNLATGVGVSVGELVERIQRIVGRHVPVLQTEDRRRPAASEVYRLLGSATQARDLAGWHATTALDDGLALTVEWVRANLRSYRVGEYRI